MVWKARVKGHKASEVREVTCYEAPLESFDEALDQLKSAVLKMCELPESWRESITIKWMGITYTKQGTRQAQIGFSKHWAKTHNDNSLKTPEFFIEDGTGSEDFKKEAPDSVVTLVLNMVHEAERYVNNERQQLLLEDVMRSTEPVEPEDGDQVSMDLGSDWSQVDVPMHEGTNIPNFREMEAQHAYWLIDQYEDRAELKQDIEYNFGEKLDARRSLEACQTAAKEVIRSFV